MKAVKNYLYNLTYQILVMVLPLVLTPYISRVLEVDGIGKYSVAVAVANYFILFGMLGINSYGNRQIAYVRDNPDLMRKTFWELNVLKLLTMGSSIVLYILFVLLTIPCENMLLYFMEGLTLVSHLVDISWFFAGMEQFKKTSTRNIIVKLVGVALVFLFVKGKDDLWVYALIIAGSSLSGQLVMWRVLPKELRKIEIDRLRLSYHFKSTIRLWLPSIAIQVYSSLDKVMLGYLVNDTQAGLYENSQKIVKMAATIPTALSTVLVPRMSNLFVNGDMKTFRATAEKSFSFVSMVSFPLCFGIISIKNTLVPWFYGQGFEDISNLLLISAWLVITLGWSSILGLQILVSAKRENKYTISVTIGAVANVILNCCFIMKYQSAGALVASVVAEYIGMFSMMYFSRDLISVKNCMKCVPKYAFASLIMCVVSFITGELMGYCMLSSFVQVLLGAVVYIILLLLFKDEQLKYGINKLKEMTSKAM